MLAINKIKSVVNLYSLAFWALVVTSLWLCFATIGNTPQAAAVACPTDPGHQITSGYGMRNGRMHHGIDIGVEYRPIYAAESGNVVSDWEADGYGLYKDLHANSGRVYRYAHLAEGGVNGNVGAGAHIGTSNNTGSSTGPHLHWEIRINGESINPANEYEYCSSGGGGGVLTAPQAGNVTILGRLWVASGGPAGGGVAVDLCGPGWVTTDNNGFFVKSVPVGTYFCVRANGYKALNNRPGHSGDSSYEWQIAGKDCYNNAAGNCPNDPVREWDRGYRGGDDDGYDLKAPGVGIGGGDSGATMARGKIQGQSVERPTYAPLGGVTKYLDSAVSTTANPYVFNNLAAGNHTVTASTPNGYTLLGYTLCYNTTICHGSSPINSAIVNINVPAGGFADLYWHYSRIAPITPPTTQTPPPPPPAPTPQPTPTPPPPTAAVTGRLIRNLFSSRCLDVANASRLAGARTILWGCHGDANQLWSVGSDKTIKVYGNMCLDVAGGGRSNGTPVIIYTCHGSTNQQWTIGRDFTIRSVGTGKCLDVYGRSRNNGTNAIIWDCIGAASQRWN